MKVKACAKINLTLDIIGKRCDGYHIIDSVFQSVNLFDEIFIEKSSGITVGCSVGSIDNQNNIVYKAAEKFFENTKINGGAAIEIKKNIPLAAGLGGGSADAAAVIVALDRLYETNLSNEQICSIGLSVGADVPFCTVGGTARVGGIGEIIEKLPDIPDCAVLIIKHGQKQSTAEMYKKIDTYPDTPLGTQGMLSGIEKGDLYRICQNVSNAFSKVSYNQELINNIKTTKPLAVSLSGSGPAVFAIYENAQKAETALQKLTVMGYNPVIAAPINKGVIFE